MKLHDIEISNDNRTLVFDGISIQFPDALECKSLDLIGQFEDEALFVAKDNGDDPYLIVITPDDIADELWEYAMEEQVIKASSDMYLTYSYFNLRPQKHTRGENPTIDKLLDVNKASEVYFIEDTDGCCNKMLVASPEKQLSEIEFYVSDIDGAIDKLILSEEPTSAKQLERSYICWDSIYILTRKTCLIGHYSNSIGMYIACPIDVIEPGRLYWQAI